MPVLRSTFQAARECESVGEEGERSLIERGEELQLGDIDAALARLALGDEGLGATKLLRHLGLGEMGVQPSLPEAFKKLLIVAAVNAGHCPSLKDRQCYYSVLEYPKFEYTEVIMKRMLVPFILVALLSSCASVGRNFDERNLGQLKPGVSTESDVIELLGAEPYMRTYSADGSYLATWQHVQTIFIVTVDNKLVHLAFDRNKVFKRLVSAVNVSPRNLPSPSEASPAKPKDASELSMP